MTGHLQDQIEAQQTLRDEAEETAKKQIDAIQSEIDGLQKANDERKQQLDLEEKLYNLERAKNQKTTRIFRESEGGFVYEADSEAVRNAQSEYEDALFEQTISDMEDKSGISRSPGTRCLRAMIWKSTDFRRLWSPGTASPRPYSVPRI